MNREAAARTEVVAFDPGPGERGLRFDEEMLGISPELTQAAFRVSDSAVNVCTPMFPFYPLLIMYCQKYCKQAGVGTLSSMMIPYTLALLVALTFVLYAFWGIGIPIGFDSGYVYPPVK